MVINTEVEDYQKDGDDVIVKVRVYSLTVIPDEFREIRARARALTATGFASSAAGVLDDVELSEVDRLTRTLDMVRENGNEYVYTVMVDVPV
jgi:hypothetical protein